MMRAICRWTLRVAVLALLVCLLAVVFAPASILPPLARWLNISDTPAKVDFVLVLNGDPQIRPFAAAALVKAGVAREILLTKQQTALESASVQDGVMLSEIEMLQKVLTARGVAPSAVRVLPGEITSTADEARLLAEFLDANPHATVAVVTNGFHTRRARMVFRSITGANADRVSYVGVPRDWVDEDAWWQTPGGCSVYVSEYAKLGYYWFRY